MLKQTIKKGMLLCLVYYQGIFIQTQSTYPTHPAETEPHQNLQSGLWPPANESPTLAFLFSVGFDLLKS